MKQIISILILLGIAAGALAVNPYLMVIARKNAAGGAALNTVDWSKGFESGVLEAGLTESDASNDVDYASTTLFHDGSQSLEVRVDLNATGGYIRKDMGSTRSSASICFWFYAADDLFTVNYQILTIGSASVGTQSFRVYYASAQFGNDGFRARGTTYPSLGDIIITPPGWYRIEVYYQQNADSTLTVYDAAGSQVGSTITVTALNNSCQYLYFGDAQGVAYPSNGDPLYFDSIGVDWTDATSPLWEYAIDD